MAVAILVMHFPDAEEVGKQDWRMRCWPGVFESILETWEAAQEERSRGAEKIVDGASRGLALQGKEPMMNGKALVGGAAATAVAAAGSSGSQKRFSGA